MERKSVKVEKWVIVERDEIKCGENKSHERKDEDDWVRKCTKLNVDGVVGRSTLRETWRKYVDENIVDYQWVYDERPLWFEECD